MNYSEIINFWFNELTPKQWFIKDAHVDKIITERFSSVHAMAKNNELSSWRKEPLGRLAEIIILDQFSRNIFRNDSRSFSQDPQALALAQEAIELGIDQSLTISQKPFLYMPFMHSESLAMHERAMELFSVKDLEHNLEYEKKHFSIIKNFGRYPHRNEILGRISTKEEMEFLKEPGSSF